MCIAPCKSKTKWWDWNITQRLAQPLKRSACTDFADVSCLIFCKSNLQPPVPTSLTHPINQMFLVVNYTFARSFRQSHIFLFTKTDAFAAVAIDVDVSHSLLLYLEKHFHSWPLYLWSIIRLGVRANLRTTVSYRNKEISEEHCGFPLMTVVCWKPVFSARVRRALYFLF